MENIDEELRKLENKKKELLKEKAEIEQKRLKETPMGKKEQEALAEGKEPKISKVPEEKSTPQKQESPQGKPQRRHEEWYIRVTTDEVQVSQRDQKPKTQFRVPTYSYVDKVMNAIHEHGKAVLAAKGHAMKRAIDIALNERMGNIAIIDTKYGVDVIEKKNKRQRRISTLEIWLKKKGEQK